MTALVNTIMLASELAQMRLEDNWTMDSGWKMYVDTKDVRRYTNIAQKKFDAYYDEFLTVIERSKYKSSKHV